jgi:hypothetical protein
VLERPAALHRRLQAMGVDHLLLPNHSLPSWAAAPPPPFSRVYADADGVLFELCYISTCMPSSTTRLGGRLK